jgi:hypothetical protein
MEVEILGKDWRGEIWIILVLFEKNIKKIIFKKVFVRK